LLFWLKLSKATIIVVIFYSPKIFMTKIKSNLLTLFSSTLIFLFVFSSVPQALAQSENLGKLEFGTQPSKGWVSNLNSKKALDVLKSDMVELSPTFVFETPSKKGVLFGTWKEFKPGVAFNAEGLNAEPPPVPKEWGKVDMKIFPQTNSDLSYAGFTVQGMGDTTSFVKKTSQTAGAWIDIPMTYTDPTGPHSGLASLYFRGPLNEYTGPNGGEKLIQKILSELQIQQGVKLIAFQDYKKLFDSNPDYLNKVIVEYGFFHNPYKEEYSKNAEFIKKLKDKLTLESKGVNWQTKVNSVVSYLTPQREMWETNKEFSARKNALLELTLQHIKLKVELKDASVDQETGTLFINISIDNGSFEKFAFKDAPQQVRKEALVSVKNFRIRQEFYVTGSGQFGISAFDLYSDEGGTVKGQRWDARGKR